MTDQLLDKNVSTHTPGPWHVRNDGSVGSVQRGGMVVAQPCIEPKNQGDQAANARLIAAAPELLDALEGMREALAECEGWTQDQQSAYGKALAAISKARGA